MEEELELIGEITHYFDKISVAVVKLFKPLRVKDVIRIKGPNVDFTQEVESMEIDHQKIEKAGAGESVGLKVKEKVKEGYRVYRV